MIRDPEIEAFRDDLERLGNVVAPHRDHLCVRLPLFASVRVRIDGEGRLACEPMFGPLPRTPALLLNPALVTAAAVGGFYVTGAAPIALAGAFLAIMSALSSVWRFVLTENCITRVQLLWAARTGATAAGRPALPHGSLPTLRAVEVPAPDLTPIPRATAERRR